MPEPLKRHLEGRDEARPVEALTRPGLARSIDFGAEPERARLVTGRALAARAATGKGGRPPLQCIDGLISGPPPFESAEAWPIDSLEDWSRDSIKWLRSLLPPDTPLYTAHLHTDETSPHLHPSFPPALTDAKGVTALSWKRMQAYMAENAAGQPIRNPASQLRAVQDSYHREVGQRYGLDRGKVGAKIDYAPLDRTEGLRRRAAGAEARAAEERERRTEAETQKLDAEKRKATAERARARSEAEALGLYDDSIQLLQDVTKANTARHKAEQRATTAETTAKAQTAAALTRERDARMKAEKRATDSETAKAQTAAELARERDARMKAEKRATDSDDTASDERERRTETERRTAAELAHEREIRDAAVARANKLEEAAESRTEPDPGAALVQLRRRTHVEHSATRRNRTRHRPPHAPDRRQEQTRAQMDRRRPDPRDHRHQRR